MASMRLSARGTAASAPVFVPSARVPSSLACNWAPHSLFNSGGHVSSTLAPR